MECRNDGVVVKSKCSFPSFFFSPPPLSFPLFVCFSSSSSANKKIRVIQRLVLFLFFSFFFFSSPLNLTGAVKKKKEEEETNSDLPLFSLDNTRETHQKKKKRGKNGKKRSELKSGCGSRCITDESTLMPHPHELLFRLTLLFCSVFAIFSGAASSSAQRRWPLPGPRPSPAA